MCPVMGPEPSKISDFGAPDSPINDLITILAFFFVFWPPEFIGPLINQAAPPRHPAAHTFENPDLQNFEPRYH